MNDLEREILNFDKKINEEKDLSKSWELYSEMIKKVENANREEITKRCGELVVENIVPLIGNCQDFYQQWTERGTHYTDKKLEEAKKVVENILDFVGKIGEKEFPSQLGDDYRSSSEKGLKTIVEKIQEEIIRRKDSPDDDETIDKQITALQSKIKALEDKIRDTSDSDTVRQYQQELQELKVELQEKERIIIIIIIKAISR